MFVYTVWSPSGRTCQLLQQHWWSLSSCHKSAAVWILAYEQAHAGMRAATSAKSSGETRKWRLFPKLLPAGSLCSSPRARWVCLQAMWISSFALSPITVVPKSMLILTNLVNSFLFCPQNMSGCCLRKWTSSCTIILKLMGWEICCLFTGKSQLLW